LNLTGDLRIRVYFARGYSQDFIKFVVRARVYLVRATPLKFSGACINKIWSPH
jgi:hypothetical protein